MQICKRFQRNTSHYPAISSPKMEKRKSASSTWNLKHPFINGCFSWMIPNLYIQKWLEITKHPWKKLVLRVPGTCYSLNNCLRFTCAGKTILRPKGLRKKNSLRPHRWAWWWHGAFERFSQRTITCLGGGFKYVLFSSRKLGKIPILTNIFQMGWNHQPAINLL